MYMCIQYTCQILPIFNVMVCFQHVVQASCRLGLNNWGLFEGSVPLPSPKNYQIWLVVTGT